jgi:hypothetical protein
MTDSRSRTFAMAALVVLVMALVAGVIYLGRDEYHQLSRENGETIGSQTSADELVGPGRLKIGEAERRASGIEVAPLVAAEADDLVDIQGVVVDLRPLVEARARYATQSAEIRGLRSAAVAAKAEAERARALFRDDRNVSERAMQLAEAESRAAAERLAAAETMLRGQVDTLRATWGATLADMAVNSESAGFAPLARGDEVLVQVTLPYESEAAAANRPLTLAPVGGQGRSRARLVSAAPIAGAGGTVGAAYFYRAPAAGLRVGNRVVGHLSSAVGASTGVVVPERAVVWFAARPWIYVRDEKDADVFERTSVSATRLVPGGWFNAAGLEPGQQVVVVGAQLLLSEELEFQIRNENED